RRRRLADVPPDHPAAERLRAARRRHAGVCVVVRRNHRHAVHGRSRPHAAHLVLQRAVPAARAANHQRGRSGGDDRDVYSDPARLPSHPARFHMNTKLLINGKLVAGKGEKEDVLDPATSKPLASVAEASPEQIASAVAAAAKAFAAWSATVPKDRAALLLKIADRIEAEAADYARLESQNCGKPYAAVLNDEIPAIVDVSRFFAGAARTLHGAVAGEYLPGFTSMIRRDPVGVVASIAPWNYPLMMAAWKLSPALAGGNTVVIKPSEQTPLSTLKLATILAELFPAGVVNIVHGRGPTVGASLISQPQVSMVSLTGDVSTGEKVLQAAAKGAKRTHLELGGKAPVIVFDDADLESVVGGVRTFGFYNAGQDCTAACRIYAAPKIHDKLVAELSAAASSIKTGSRKKRAWRWVRSSPPNIVRASRVLLFFSSRSRITRSSPAASRRP